MYRIIGIEACYIDPQGFVVDLSNPNKYYKSTMSDNLDLIEIVRLSTDRGINTTFDFSRGLFNAIIDVSFTKDATKFYDASIKEDVYLEKVIDKDQKHPVAILSGHSKKELKDLTFDGILFKDNDGNVVAALRDIAAKEDVDGLEIDKKTQKYRIKVLKTAYELRKELYSKGFTVQYIENNKIEKIKYVRYKRSASAAKAGKCLFIREDFFDDMMKWTQLYDEQQKYGDLSIDPKNDKEIINQPAAWESYIALSLSGIEGSIEIPLDSVLIVKDETSEFSTKAIVATKTEDRSLKMEEKNYTIKNTIWDGEGLLDESVFKEYGYENNGMLLLRNKFLKSCVFNTKLQKWFNDNNITSIKQLNKNFFTNAKRIEDIKLVMTYSSFKLLKFADKIEDLFKEKPKKSAPDYLDKMIMLSSSKANTFSFMPSIKQDCVSQEDVYKLITEWWYDYCGKKFGVVKHDKSPKFMFGKMVQANYQLLNTLPLTYDDVKKLYEPALDFLDNVGNVEYARLFLKMNVREKDQVEDEYEEDDVDSLTSFKTELMLELLKRTDEVKKTRMFNEFKEDIRDSLKKKYRKSKILIDGTYATLFSNGYALLKYLICKEGEFNINSFKPAIKPGEIMCTRFEDGEELLCERNPHITMGNLYRARNIHSEVYKEYFNLTPNIVCVNSINEDIMNRLNGADFDSDTMLITNNKILVDAADKIINRFKVPTYDLKPAKKKLNLCDLDDAISNNSIGIIVNLSQRLNSIYWDVYNKNPNDQRLDELYKQICKLAVLSNLEIDKAKRDYDVDSNKVMNEVRDAVKLLFNDELVAHQLKTDNSKQPSKAVIIDPSFLKSGEKPIYDTSCEYVQKIINDIPKAKKSSGKYCKLCELIKYDGDYSLTNEEKEIINELHELKDNLTDNKKTYQEINNDLYDTFEKIKDNLSVIIKDNRIGKLFKVIDKELQISDLKATEKRKEAVENIYLLYFINMLGKLDKLFPKQEITELVMDEIGDIDVYGYKFKKIAR